MGVFGLRLFGYAVRILLLNLHGMNRNEQVSLPGVIHHLANTPLNPITSGFLLDFANKEMGPLRSK